MVFVLLKQMPTYQLNNFNTTQSSVSLYRQLKLALSLADMLHQPVKTRKAGEMM